MMLGDEASELSGVTAHREREGSERASELANTSSEGLIDARARNS